MMAAACVVVMPCIIVFLIGQRYLSRELPCPASKVRRRSFVIGKDYIDWTQSACQKAAVVSGITYRFSVLTPYMIRMEYAADGVFEDRATQAVINRNFSVPDFRVKDDGILLEVLTESLHLIYQKKAVFSGKLKRSAHWKKWKICAYSSEPLEIRGKKSMI